MSALCLARASASVSSCPLVVGSLKSGALSPTFSTFKSLSSLENVPAGTRDATDSRAGAECGLKRLAHRQSPCSRKRRIVATQGHDVVGHLTRDHSRG